MDLARRILEGIHEVELQVTPEFRKPERGVDVDVLNRAFHKNGWKIVKASSKEKKGTITNTYHHPKIPGAEMIFTFDNATSKVLGQMLVRSGEEFEPLRFDATPEAVESLTKQWLDIGEKYKPVAEIGDALKLLGWVPAGMKTAHGTFTDAFFTHPKVSDMIVVRYSKWGAITSARVEHKDGSFDGIDTPLSTNIVATAKRLTPEVPGASDWGPPKRITWEGSPRLEYMWALKAVVRGVLAKAHPGSVYAISWPKSSVGLKGHWGQAIQAIKDMDGWDRIYVYGVPESHMAEFDELNIQGIVQSSYYPGNADYDPTYDANIADMMTEYLGHVEKPEGSA